MWGQQSALDQAESRHHIATVKLMASASTAAPGLRSIKPDEGAMDAVKKASREMVALNQDTASDPQMLRAILNNIVYSYEMESATQRDAPGKAKGANSAVVQ